MGQTGQRTPCRVSWAVLFIGWLSITIAWLLWTYGSMCHWKSKDAIISMSLFGDPQIEGNTKIESGWRGIIDVYYNDYYLRHVVNNIMAYLEPSHVVVMGDLFSSQLIDEVEFDKRTARYNWMFQSVLDRPEVPFINLVGNHDIGYATDVLTHRMDRFIQAFGQVDFAEYLIPPSDQCTLTPPESSSRTEALAAAGAAPRPVLLVVSNAQVLESFDGKMQPLNKWHQQAWANFNSSIELKAETDPIVLYMLHIPLDKPGGICVDSPVITRRTSDQMVSEQTMMSRHVSDQIIDKLQPHFIFNGHDHEGCYYVHTSPVNNWTVPEYTIRSMMGDYSGVVALFELRLTEDGGYEYEFQYCTFIPLQWVTVVIVSNLAWPIVYFVTLLIEKYCCAR